MPELPHFDDSGAARMVDVGAKQETFRVAVASGLVIMKPETMALIEDREIQKGDVLELARIAGIMASKKTPELIPLCHPIQIDAVNVELNAISDTQLKIEATVSVTGRTGVEMEALTAVAGAALTVYDMCKSVDRGMRITEIRLEKKSGGKSGSFSRPSDITNN